MTVTSPARVTQADAKKAPVGKSKRANAAKTTATKAPRPAPMDPSLTVLKVLDGEIGREALKGLPVAVQVLLVEVLLEQSREKHFDQNNTFTGTSFSGLVAELLDCTPLRAQTILKAMRRRKSYSGVGHGRVARITFTGSLAARAVLDEVEITKGSSAVTQVLTDSPAAKPVDTTDSTAKATPVQAPPAAMPEPLEFGVPRPRQGVKYVVLHGAPELVDAEAALVRVLADHVAVNTNGDPALVAGVILELAKRFRFSV